MVTGVFLPSVGGIQTQTFELGLALVAAGARVRVLTRWHAGTARHEERDGVEVVRVGRGDATRAVATGSFVAAATAHLVSHRRAFDVIHAHQLLSPATVALAAGALGGSPIVLNPHACGPSGDVQLLQASRAGRLRLEAARRRAHAFVSISPAIHAELLGAGIDPARIHDVPNGVDLRRFCPATSGEQARLRAELRLPRGPLAVYAGRLAREKGIDVLLGAWRRVVAAVPDASLLILGDGAEAARVFREAAAVQGILARGAVPDVAPYLRASDVSVLPSRTEGLPVALLEAMACGLRCVATRTPGAAEVLGPGRTGWQVPTEDAPALAAALVEALRTGDPAIGEAARARVKERYDLTAVARRYLVLYEHLLAARPGAAVELAR